MTRKSLGKQQLKIKLKRVTFKEEEDKGEKI